jgi:hypothetical protein
MVMMTTKTFFFLFLREKCKMIGVSENVEYTEKRDASM